MKKISLISVIALLALIAIFYNRFTGASSNEKASAKEHSTPQELLENDTTYSDEADSTHLVARSVKNPKREQEYIKQRKRVISKSTIKLRELSQASEQDIRSATVSAEINPGETLVTGGYKRPNGNYEFNFLTPISIDNTGRANLDGSHFELNNKIVSIRAEVIEGLRLERLITDSKNTLQHSEVWTQDTLKNAFANMADNEGVDVMNLPSVLASPDKPFSIASGGSDGYTSIEGSLDRGPNGGILIQSTVERYGE